MTNGKERFAIWIRDNHSLESKVDAPSRYGTPHSSQLEAAFADYGAPEASTLATFTLQQSAAAT
jgi:hypothetical protein